MPIRRGIINQPHWQSQLQNLPLAAVKRRLGVRSFLPAARLMLLQSTLDHHWHRHHGWGPTCREWSRFRMCLGWAISGESLGSHARSFLFIAMLIVSLLKPNDRYRLIDPPTLHRWRVRSLFFWPNNTTNIFSNQIRMHACTTTGRPPNLIGNKFFFGHSHSLHRFAPFVTWGAAETNRQRISACRSVCHMGVLEASKPHEWFPLWALTKVLSFRPMHNMGVL